MAEISTFIKLDRNITQWRWYQDANTFRVFIHCLISANIKDCNFERIMIHRGELATSYEKIARALKISIMQTRTAVNHLKLTGELTIKRYSKYQVFTVVNYDLYQAPQQSNQQSSNNQVTIKQQQSKNVKNVKNTITTTTLQEAHAREETEPVNLPPVLSEVVAYFNSEFPEFDNVAMNGSVEGVFSEAKKFHAYNANRGWDCLPDWRAAANLWVQRIDEAKQYKKS